MVGGGCLEDAGIVKLAAAAWPNNGVRRARDFEATVARLAYRI